MSTGNSSVAQQQIENPTHTQEYVCPRMDHELTKGGWAKFTKNVILVDRYQESQPLIGY